MGMANSSDLERFLAQLAEQAEPGARLPTIRELMRRFGVSQVIVQRAFQELKDRGLIASEVGRGTYFLGEGRAAPSAPEGSPPAAAGRASRVKSVLLLRRSISVARGRVLVEGLQRRFTGDGHRVLELSYTDPDHARTVLKGLPRFDACVVQSTYKTITIELLAALREKCAVLAVDGAALIGADVEAVGTEWGDPLASAVALLQQHGHRSIAFATTSHPLLATQLGLRRFTFLQNTVPQCELHAITVPQLPDENYEAAVVEEIRARFDAAGRPPFTALVAWGIENGASFRQALARIGLAVPSALSVVLLGRTDLPNEHADFFHTVGSSVADQIDALHEVIQARWAHPSAPYAVRLTPVLCREGQSVAPPAAPARSRLRASAAA